MGRSKWKGPFIEFEGIKNKKLSVNKQSSASIITSRNSDIVPSFLGLEFLVYTGKKYTEITVTEGMIGHKFGEFVFTRAKFVFKKKNKKKRGAKN